MRIILAMPNDGQSNNYLVNEYAFKTSLPVPDILFKFSLYNLYVFE